MTEAQISDAVKLKLKDNVSWTKLLGKLRKLYPDAGFTYDVVRRAVRNSAEYKIKNSKERYPSSDETLRDGTQRSTFEDE